DGLEDLDARLVARPALEVDPHAVHAQQEGGRVGLGAEAVVGHGPEGVLPRSVEQGAEAADGLARIRGGRWLGVPYGRERRGRAGIGRQQGTAFEGGLGGDRRGGGCGDGCGGGDREAEELETDHDAESTTAAARDRDDPV
ncbi:MAG: hypothetical protein AVDCRST_MAG53-2504, partial [uncultured Solirubrobacteraceae bacterium]